MRVAFLFFVVPGLLLSPVATSYSVGNRPSIATRTAFSRRAVFARTALLGGAAAAPFPRPAAAAAAKPRAADAELVRATSARYRAALSDRARLVADLASEDASAPSPLPPQIPAAVFQKLVPFARTVPGGIDADDYPFVAVEYAEHAGAARDLARLARLGRIGENGSAEVALNYAQRCVAELEQASAVLDTLRQANDL